MPAKYPLVLMHLNISYFKHVFIRLAGFLQLFHVIFSSLWVCILFLIILPHVFMLLIFSRYTASAVFMNILLLLPSEVALSLISIVIALIWSISS